MLILKTSSLQTRMDGAIQLTRPFPPPLGGGAVEPGTLNLEAILHSSLSYEFKKPVSSNLFCAPVDGVRDEIYNSHNIFFWYKTPVT